MRLRAELDRPVQPAGRSGRAVLKISLEPERIAEMRERPPVNLAIAMDNSGSMSGHKMEHARRAALEALGKLGPRDRFALVTYNDRPETVIPSQHPRRHNRPQMQEQIRNIRANNSTALYAGVNEAAAEVRRGAAEGTINRIILLSDGQANVGPSSPEDLRALGNALAGEDIVVSSVGLGDGFNEDLMTGIAQAGQGNSYFVENSGDLTRIFESELSDTMNVSATDVTLVVELAPGVRPVGIIGREGRVSGNKAEFQMRQLFGGQRKFALIELEVPAGQDGQQQEIAEINVNYIHAPSGKPRHSRARAQASYSQDEQAVRKAANPHVARAVVDNRLAETQRRAVHLSDSGQHRQAAQEMRRLNQDVTLMNMMFEDAEIANQAAAITREAVQLERNRLSNTERKNYFYRSYQTINQQQSAQ